MKDTTILLVRHGESEGNVLGLFTGHSGYSLSKLGHTQAAKTAEYIHATYEVDAVYSSDLPRAFQTAEYIAKTFSSILIPSLIISRSISSAFFKTVSAGEFSTGSGIYSFSSAYQSC